MKHIISTILVALFIAPAALAQDEGAAIADFKKQFRTSVGKPTSASKLIRALKLLHGLDSPRAAGALMEGYLKVDKELDKVEAKRAKFNREIEKLSREVQEKLSDNERKRLAMRSKQMKIMKLERESAPLRERVDQLSEVHYAVLDEISKFTKVDTLSWLVGNVMNDKAYPLALKLRVTHAAGKQKGAMVPALVGALERASDPSAIAALLDGIVFTGEAAKTAAPKIIALLEATDEGVRERAALALAKIAVPEAIEPMINLLARSRGLMKKRIVAALEVLTRQKHGISVAAWQRWWKAEGAVYASGSKELGGGTPSAAEEFNKKNYYYDIPQDGKSILYVLDCSGSMVVSYKNPRKAPNGGNMPGAPGKRRLDACKKELIKAIQALPPTTKFNVIWYSHQPTLYKKKMMFATEKNVKKAVAYIEPLQPAGTTNIYDTMKLAFTLTGRGSHDKHYGVEFDMIFLLTDGTPTKPGGGLDSTDKILDGVRKWNALKRVVIHTIGIGKQLNLEFMKKLAADNGGQFKQDAQDTGKKKRKAG